MNAQKCKDYSSYSIAVKTSEFQDAEAKEEDDSRHAHKPLVPQDDYPLDCKCYLKSKHRNYCYLFIGFFIFIGYVLLGNLSGHQVLLPYL